MKRKILLCLCGALFLSASAGFAAGVNPPCKTKYPIVLVHGAFFKDENLLGINYWWGIPEALEEEGAIVYVTQQDTFNGVEERARQIARELAELFAVHPEWRKVNLIAHSQGPLDCRFLITNLTIPGRGAARNCVASLTSISGTHRGSEMAELLWKLYKGIPVLGPAFGTLIAEAVNAFASVFYYNEEDQNSLKLLYNLTPEFVINTFNPNTPNVPGVYYQSWAGKVKYISPWHADDLIVGPLWTIMKLMGAGDNDCLVSVESAKWGRFRGVITGTDDGVNHFNEINHFFGVTPGWDAEAFYVEVVAELKKMGY
ncbi:MAG: alpha/beta hydrolase [Spirochaetes bacterium]|nr:alpha/beta hydrolase [Spirochaetota bacterium]